MGSLHEMHAWYSQFFRLLDKRNKGYKKLAHEFDEILRSMRKEGRINIIKRDFGILQPQGLYGILIALVN